MAAEIKTGDAVTTRASTTTPVATAAGSASDGDETDSEDAAMPTGANHKALAGAVGMAGAIGAVLAL